MYVEVQDLFRSRSLAEWSHFSQHVDCCIAPVLETSEIAKSPYVIERGLIKERWGLYYVATRYLNSGSHLDDSVALPKLGEHTAKVMNQEARS